MNDKLLLAAIGCGRLPGILKTVKENSFVVFGAMDNKNISIFTGSENGITGVKIYFYETG